MGMIFEYFLVIVCADNNCNCYKKNVAFVSCYKLGSLFGTVRIGGLCVSSCVVVITALQIFSYFRRNVKGQGSKILGGAG